MRYGLWDIDSRSWMTTQTWKTEAEALEEIDPRMNDVIVKLIDDGEEDEEEELPQDGGMDSELRS